MANGLSGGISNLAPPIVGADALAMPTTAEVLAANQLYNGATWDLQRNNQQGTLLASAARTVSTTSPVQTNFNAKGVVMFANVTAVSGTGGLTLRGMAIDPISGASVQVLGNSTVITTAGLVAYVWYPGATPLPRSWQVFVSAGDASSYTYSIGYSYIV